MGEGRWLEEGVVGGDEEAKVLEEEKRVELFVSFFDWNILLSISLSLFHWQGGRFHSGGNN